MTAHYTGKTVPDVGLGFVFDSSRGGEPLEFQIGVGQVIKGWDEGIMKMSLGERATLTCTPDYAYGAAGAPPDIPPDATLEFDVEPSVPAKAGSPLLLRPGALLRNAPPCSKHAARRERRARAG